MSSRWALVLAGGRGTRLASLTTVGSETIPKQYCSLAGGPSMLRDALARARVVAAASRVLVVVNADQRSWWEPQLRDVPPGNVVVQPAERGTAAGVLLPLAHIRGRDDRAVVAVLPSDHYVDDERPFGSAIRRACELVERRQRPIALVGIAAEEPDPELGWIVPSTRLAGGSGSGVERFREKPTRDEAVELFRTGALVNTFAFAADVRALWQLCDRLIPSVAARLTGKTPVEAAYAGLERRDFSTDVLQQAAESLAVVSAGPCGWSDLGTPERVRRCLARRPAGSRPQHLGAALDLSRQLALAL
jgi:mannose-1-phosphate guanylyltransferase